MAPPRRVRTRQDTQQMNSQHHSGSSSTPLVRVMRGVVEKARKFHSEIPMQAQAEIHDAEEDARVSRGCLTDDEIREEFEALVLDLGNTRGRSTLYQKTLDLHWSHNLILCKALTDRNEAQAEILMQDMLKQVLYNQQQFARHFGITLAKDPTTQPDQKEYHNN